MREPRPCVHPIELIDNRRKRDRIDRIIEKLLAREARKATRQLEPIQNKKDLALVRS